MKTIWKFPLELKDENIISMPVGARVLSVAMQNNNLCIWAQVNPEAYKEPRTFAIYGTGHPVQFDDQRFIGTAMSDDGSLVWHIFEV